jgi:hypothetical protein
VVDDEVIGAIGASFDTPEHESLHCRGHSRRREFAALLRDMKGLVRMVDGDE